MIHSEPLISALRSRHFYPPCVRQFTLKRATAQKRTITQNYPKTTEETKQEWAKQATEIRAGRRESMLAMLEKRGYINQIVGCVVEAMEITSYG